MIHETQLLQTLVDPARYNKMAAPRQSGADSVTVRMGLSPVELVEVVRIREKGIHCKHRNLFTDLCISIMKLNLQNKLFN